MRESIPSQVDEKSRVPEVKNGVWGSQGGEKDLRISRRRKGQTFFSTLLCLSQYNNVGFVISEDDLALGPGTRLDHSRAFVYQSFIEV